jgi:integrase
MRGYIKPNYDRRDKDKPIENRRIISFRIGAPKGKNSGTGKYEYAFETVKTDSWRIAQKRLNALISEIDRGIHVTHGKQSLKDYLEHWLEDYCQPNLAPDTTETYRIMCHTHIDPAIGHIPLTALKSQNIQHLESQKLLSGRHDGKGGLGNRSVKYIHSTLNKSLKMAVKQGLLMRNPVDGVEPSKIKRHQFKTLNEDDINNLLEVLKDSEYYALFFTDMFSGMRRSEILGLRWKDIDLIGMTASVNRVIKCMHRQISFRPPKTTKSRRLIDLTPANTVILREYKSKQAQQRIALKVPPLSEDDLVFSHFNGSPLLPDTMTHVWMMLVRRNGLSGIRLHDIRHSHASLLLKQGIHPKIVQERLGHATISTTLDLYSHVAPGMQAAAAAGFDGILKPKENKLDKELKDLVQN